MTRLECSKSVITMSEDEQPQAVFPQQGPSRDEMAANYLPESDEWSAKTALDLNDPQALAALGQFAQMFPEVEDLQGIIDDFTEEFMKSRTSVNAQSRDEYKDMIMSMYGGGPEDDDGMNAFAKALAGDMDDD